jgi:hypothetical protein
MSGTATSIRPATRSSPVARNEPRLAMQPAYQAYLLLQVGFAVLPIVAGLDKFVQLLVNWDISLRWRPKLFQCRSTRSCWWSGWSR